MFVWKQFLPKYYKDITQANASTIGKKGEGVASLLHDFFLKPPTTKMTLPQYIGNETPSQEIIQRKNASIGKCNYWYLLFNCKATLGNNSFYCG